MHCVDLGESFPTSIYLQNLVSIQLKTSPETSKFEFRITQRFNFPMVFSPVQVLTNLGSVLVRRSYVDEDAEPGGTLPDKEAWPPVAAGSVSQCRRVFAIWKM